MSDLVPGVVAFIAALTFGVLIVRLIITVEIRRLEEERYWQAQRTGSFAEVYDWAEEHDL